MSKVGDCTLASNGTTTAVLNLPVGAAVGDVFVGGANTNSGSATCTAQSAGGHTWTQTLAAIYQSSNTAMFPYLRALDSTDISNGTVTFTVNASGRPIAAGAVFRGAGTWQTPTLGNNVTQAPAATLAGPDLVTVGVNSDVVLFVTNRVASGTFSTTTPGAGFTADNAQGTANGAGVNMGAAVAHLTTLVGSGSTVGAQTIGGSPSPAQNIALIVELDPASGTTYQGDAATPLTLGLTADARTTKLADAATPLTVGFTADTTRTTLAQSATPLEFNVTAALTKTTLGQSASVFTLAMTADVSKVTLGQASTALTLSFTADVSKTTLGQASTPLALGLTADLTKTTLGQTATPLSFGFTASASVGSIPKIGDASSVFTLGLTADLAKVTLGQASTPLTLGFTAAGTRVTLGQTVTPFTLGFTADSRRTTLAQTSTPLGLGLTADARLTGVAQALTQFALAFTAAATVTPATGVPGFSFLGSGPGPSSQVTPGASPTSQLNLGAASSSVLSPGQSAYSQIGG